MRHPALDRVHLHQGAVFLRVQFAVHQPRPGLQFLPGQWFAGALALPEQAGQVFHAGRQGRDLQLSGLVAGEAPDPVEVIAQRCVGVLERPAQAQVGFPVAQEAVESGAKKRERLPARASTS